LVAGSDRRHVGTDGCDDAGRLVPGHDGIPDAGSEAAVLQEDVGPADAARLHAHERLARAGLRDRALGEPKRLPDPGQLRDLHRGQSIRKPPLTSITSPVMYPAGAEQRYATIAATSSGCPSRPTGISPTRSRMPATMSVSIRAGASALAVMPCSAYSLAIDFAITMIPALEAP